jgi:hypothetical protein
MLFTEINMKIFALLVLLLLTFRITIADTIHANNFDGKMVSLSGTIEDKPRRYDSSDGNYASYSFKLSSGKGSYGDEYVLVSYRVKKWGKKVGEFNLGQGEKVTLKGKFSESREKGKGGIVGSLNVNDLDYDVVKKMP